MNTTSIIIGVIALLGLIIYLIWFRPSKLRERRLRKKNENEKLLLKKKQVQKLKDKYLNRCLFLVITTDDFNPYYYLDEDQRHCKDLSLTDLSHESYGFWNWRETTPLKIIPVVIKDISFYNYSGSETRAKVCFDISADIYEFEIVYVGIIDAIAVSPILGEIYLSKQQFHQYEMGKKIKLKISQEGNSNLEKKILIEVV